MTREGTNGLGGAPIGTPGAGHPAGGHQRLRVRDVVGSTAAGRLPHARTVSLVPRRYWLTFPVFRRFEVLARPFGFLPPFSALGAGSAYLPLLEGSWDDDARSAHTPGDLPHAAEPRESAPRTDIGNVYTHIGIWVSFRHCAWIYVSSPYGPDAAGRMPGFGTGHRESPSWFPMRSVGPESVVVSATSVIGADALEETRGPAFHPVDAFLPSGSPARRPPRRAQDPGAEGAPPPAAAPRRGAGLGPQPVVTGLWSDLPGARARRPASDPVDALLRSGSPARRPPGRAQDPGAEGAPPPAAAPARGTGIVPQPVLTGLWSDLPGARARRPTSDPVDAFLPSGSSARRPPGQAQDPGAEGTPPPATAPARWVGIVPQPVLTGLWSGLPGARGPASDPVDALLPSGSPAGRPPGRAQDPGAEGTPPPAAAPAPGAGIVPQPVLAGLWSGLPGARARGPASDPVDAFLPSGSSARRPPGQAQDPGAEGAPPPATAPARGAGIVPQPVLTGLWSGLPGARARARGPASDPVDAFALSGSPARRPAGRAQDPRPELSRPLAAGETLRHAKRDAVAPISRIIEELSVATSTAPPTESTRHVPWLEIEPVLTELRSRLETMDERSGADLKALYSVLQQVAQRLDSLGRPSQIPSIEPVWFHRAF